MVVLWPKSESQILYRKHFPCFSKKRWTMLPAICIYTTQIGRKSLFFSSDLLCFSFRTTIKVTLKLCHDEVASYVSASGLTFTFAILSQRRKCLKYFLLQWTQLFSSNKFSRCYPPPQLHFSRLKWVCVCNGVMPSEHSPDLLCSWCEKRVTQMETRNKTPLVVSETVIQTDIPLDALHFTVAH